jgi:hypothetical protein
MPACHTCLMGMQASRRLMPMHVDASFKGSAGWHPRQSRGGRGGCAPAGRHQAKGGGRLGAPLWRRQQARAGKAGADWAHLSCRGIEHGEVELVVGGSQVGKHIKYSCRKEVGRQAGAARGQGLVGRQRCQANTSNTATGGSVSRQAGRQ